MTVGEEVDLLLRKIDRRPTQMRSWISRSVSWCTRRENSPCSERTALRAAWAELASIRSAMASARQVELVVEECTLAEFAVSGQAHTQLDTTLQQHVQHHRAAMAVQFQHILAGERMRAGENSSSPSSMTSPSSAWNGP